MFNDKKYWNKKCLAHAFYMSWDDAKSFVRSDTLLRWIERSVQDTDLAEKMEILGNRTGSDGTGYCIRYRYLYSDLSNE